MREEDYQIRIRREPQKPRSGPNPPPASRATRNVIPTEGGIYCAQLQGPKSDAPGPKSEV